MILRIFLLVIFCTISINVQAQSPPNKGRSIMEKVITGYDTFKDIKGDIKMILKNKSGHSRTRLMKMFGLEVPNDGDKTILLFNDPRDIRGTALLTYTHPNGINEQWIYLPAFKRIKRISDNAKASPFMGSEFSYEDLNSIELPMYTYKYMRDETLEDIPCFVIEIIPAYSNSRYSKQHVWVNQKEFRIEKIDYYDKSEKMLKTLRFIRYQKYQDKFWHPDKLNMVNHQNGKSTDLLLSNIAYRNNLKKTFFLPSSLKNFRK